MDPILTSRSILNEKNWLFFKLYKNPTSLTNWKSNLDWYHQTLIDVVKPVELNTPGIQVIFFGFYGPQPYNVEGEKYQRKMIPPNTNLLFIRLRICVKRGNKRNAKRALLTSINQNRNLVWKYESMVTYNVRNDLGGRYGSNLNGQTLRFIRYWDAACRYVLSILTLPGNWTQGVDIWGVPHLVNNSMGTYLRPERPPQLCPSCQAHMYMETLIRPLSRTIQINQNPCFLFICPDCSRSVFISSNV